MLLVLILLLLLTLLVLFKPIHTQVPMSREDEDHTAFIIIDDLFCYVSIPHGLKNTLSTFMRVMHKTFSDLIRDLVEMYVDDIVVKIKLRASLLDLRVFLGLVYGSLVLVVLKSNRIIRKRTNANCSSFYLRVFLGLSNPQGQRQINALALYLYRVITLKKEKSKFNLETSRITQMQLYKCIHVT
jgi:hypothetical protein